MTDENIRATVERNRSLLQTPQSTVAKQLVRIDPFNWLLEGRLGLELEIGILKFMSFEMVPVPASGGT